MLAAAVFEEAGAGDTFEDAFAVLVTGADVAAVQGLKQRAGVTIGFVDDDGGAVGPISEGGFNLGREGDVAVEGLLDEDEMTQWFSQRVI
jgi:hypothetical protein